MNLPNAKKREWQPLYIVSELTEPNTAIQSYINPENSLEKAITKDPCWIKGALWGEPRPGHPEGKVLYHIYEVLQNVEQLPVSKAERLDLRLIAILHDTFKHQEEKVRPRTDWERHHAIYALKFAEKYITNKAVLDIIELHDEAYYAWHKHVKGNDTQALLKMDKLVSRLGEQIKLYYWFFKCDTQTGNKYQAPILWLENLLRTHYKVEF
jgi:hypothetical protein